VDNSDLSASANGGTASAGNFVHNEVDQSNCRYNCLVVIITELHATANANGGTATVSPTTNANTTGGSANGTGGSINSANGANSGNNTNSGTGSGTGTPGVISNIGSNTSRPGGTGGAGGSGHQHHDYDCPDAAHHEAATPAHHAKPAHTASAAKATPAAHKAPVSRTAQPKGELAFTGSDVSAPLTLGLVALGAGGALSLAGRRRETATA